MGSRNLPSAPAPAFRLEASRLCLAQFDIGGVLYHSRYFGLYEEAREELFARNGYQPHEMAARAEYLAVVEAHQHFKAPIRYGDRVIVDMWTSDLSRSSVRFDYLLSVHAAADSSSPHLSAAPSSPLHWGWTRHAFVAPRDGTLRPERLPESLTSILKSILFEGAS